MAYIVLARKYRPRTFAEVSGQELATRTLQGAIRDGRIGHAYLFSGPRGTGKTTLARIFAKALNCEHGPAQEPCGECELCQEADRGSLMDLVEMDAASNRGIDDVRALRDTVGYPPMKARYRVFIIDEAHQITKDAFNALLKTIEEPPPHAIFLFATTEPHKMIGTIVSRCQSIKLAPIREDVIAARLARIFELESLRPGPGVVEELARRAGGGLRDALSMADQLIALVGAEPVLEDFGKLSNEAGSREIGGLLDLVESGDRAGVLLALPAAEGSELEIVAGLLQQLRGGLLALLCGADAPHLQGSAELRASLLERARRLGYERLERWLAEFVAARERMRELPGQERLVLELALLDLCRPESAIGLEEIARRLLQLEVRLESGEAAPRAPARAAPAEPAAARAPERGSARAPAGPPAVSASAPAPSLAPSGQASRAPAALSAAGATPDPLSALSSAGPAASAPSTAESRRAPASLSEIWKSALEEIGKQLSGLAETLRRRGRLIDATGQRVRVQLAELNDAERRQIADARGQRTARAAFSKVLAREVELFLDAGEGEPGSARAKDAFTLDVAEKFGGMIEERG